LKRWAAFAKFRDDGRICRSNAPAGQAARGIDLGQGNWDVLRLGCRRARVVYVPIETRELNDADPPAWLARVLAKPRDRPAKRRDEWPPWNGTPRQRAVAETA
jgi:transposase